MAQEVNIAWGPGQLLRSHPGPSWLAATVGLVRAVLTQYLPSLAGPSTRTLMSCGHLDAYRIPVPSLPVPTVLVLRPDGREATGLRPASRRAPRSSTYSGTNAFGIRAYGLRPSA